MDKLFENLTGYIETRIELVKLDLKEHAQDSIKSIFQVMLILFLAAFVILFLSLGVSIFLNTILNSDYWGYILVATLYLGLLIVLVLDKNKSLGKWITEMIFKDKE